MPLLQEEGAEDESAAHGAEEGEASKVVLEDAFL